MQLVRTAASTILIGYINKGQSTLQQLYFNLASVKSGFIFKLQNCLTQLSFRRQAFVRYSAGLSAAGMLLSNYLERYFNSRQDQTSAVVFQFSCGIQLAVLSCSLTTQRNSLRSCILSQHHIAEEQWVIL